MNAFSIEESLYSQALGEITISKNDSNGMC